MSMHARPVAVSLLVLLTACTALDPLPYTDPTNQRDFDAILKAVNKRLAAYSNAVTSNTGLIAYNSIVTVAAVGAVVAAVFSHGAARGNLLAGFGIGAGAATAFSSWLNPSGTNDAYRTAAYRTSCLQMAAQQFNDEIGGGNEQRMSGEVTQLTNMTDKVSGTLTGADFSKWNDATPDDIAKSKVNATAAVSQSTAAIASAKQEIAVFHQRGVIVFSALQKIDMQVYAVVKGKAVSYSDLYTSIMKSASSPGASTPGSADAGQQRKPLVGSTQSLADFNLQVTDITKLAGQLSGEHPFSTAATQVSACTVATD
ncbi:hypothetical protein [Burkholderia pyrrocinia]|uniref:Lipoprotein n=1 Tax=Burkholderia pyrrocinia TaxID=60550 RepID=A0ABZ3BMM1_BURPY